MSKQSGSNRFAHVQIALTAFLLFWQFGMQTAAASTPLSGALTINSQAAASASNFVSFQALADSLATCGVSGPVVATVVPGSGPYIEQARFNTVAGVSSTNTITIAGNGETLQFAPTTTDRNILLLDSVDFVHIDSLNVLCTGSTYGFGIKLSRGSSYCSITRCTVDLTSVTSTDGNYSGGISIAPATGSGPVASFHDNTDLYIANNTILGGYQGIQLLGAAANANVNNRLIDNVIQDWYFTGIYAFQQHGVVVSGNDISRPTRSSLSRFHGIYYFFCTASETTHNRIHNSHTSAGSASDLQTFTYGIYHSNSDASAAEPHLVANNLVYNLDGSGPTRGIYNLGSSYVHYYHNSVHIDSTAAANGSGALTRAFDLNGSVDGLDIRNNIFDVSRIAGDCYGIYLAGSNSTITCENNIVSIYPSLGLGRRYGYFSGWRTALADWQAVNGGAFGANSSETAPQLNDPLNGDLEPIANHGRDAGAQVGIATDFRGILRDAFPDVGAIESCPAPTGLHIHQLTHNSVVLRWIPQPDAISYKITLVSLDGGSNIVTFKHSNVGQKLVTGLVPGGRYSAIVRSRCSNGWGSATQGLKFKAMAAPCPAIATYSAAPVSAIKAKINWVVPAGALWVWVRWRVAGTSVWQGPVVRNNTKSHYWIAGLTAATTYEWQIKTACNYLGQGSTWSTMQTFATATNKWGSADWANAAKAEGIEVFPNPAQDNLNVRVISVGESSTELVLFSATGKQVLRKRFASTDGETALQLPLNDVAPGIYFLRASNSTLSTVHRVVIQ